MTDTIATLLAAHAEGKSLAATIEETYDRIARHADPALFIALRPKAEALAAARAPAGGRCRAASRCSASRSRSRTTSTSPACRPPPPVRPSPISRQRPAFVVERLERAGAIVVGKTNLDQFATGLVGVRSPYGVPRNALRADLIPGGSSSGSATAVGAGLVPFSLGTDTAGSGRVPAALNGIVGLKPSLGALSATGVVPACRTLDTISIFALDVADAFAAFEVACGLRRDGRLFAALSAAGAVGRRRRSSASAFRGRSARVLRRRGGGGRLRARPRSGAGARRARSSNSTSSRSPRSRELLYEGPWVAERYAATKPLIETNPDALHPVTRAIIEGARKFDAVAAFEAFYRLAELSAPGAARVGRLRRDAGSDHAAPLHGRRGRWPIRCASIRGSGPTPISSTCSISAPSRSPSGMRGDGLPSSVTLIGPPARRNARGRRGARSRRARARRWARPASPFPRWRPRRRGRRKAGSRSRWSARISRGLPLNHELVRARRPRSCAKPRPRATIASSPCRARNRRSRACCASPTAPGPRSSSRSGRSIPAAFGAFVAKIPAAARHRHDRASADGSSAKGFLVEAEAVKGAQDISRFGGWRAYLDLIPR